MSRFVNLTVIFIFFVSLIGVAYLAIKQEPIYGSCLVGLVILSFLYGERLVEMRKNNERRRDESDK